VPFFVWLTSIVFSDDAKARAQLLTAVVLAFSAAGVIATFFWNSEREALRDYQSAVAQLYGKDRRLEACIMLRNDFYLYETVLGERIFKKRIPGQLPALFKRRMSERQTVECRSIPKEDPETWEFYRCLAHAVQEVSQQSRRDNGTFSPNGDALIQELNHGAMSVIEIPQSRCGDGEPFSYENFDRTDISYADIHRGCFERAQFTDARLRHAELLGGNLRFARFTNACLAEADLTPAPVLSGQGAKHDEIKELLSALPSLRKLGDSSRLDDSDVITQLRNGKMRTDQAVGWIEYLRDSRLDPRRTDATGADFRGAILTKAKFWGAVLKEAHFEHDKTDKGDLSCAEFVAADLTKAQLKGAVLRGANFRGAKLDGANFDGANLLCADLRNVDLSKTNLSQQQKKEAMIGNRPDCAAKLTAICPK